MTVALSDRGTGVANFRTDTEVASRATVDIAPSTVPEAGSTFWLLLGGGLILCALDTLLRISGLKASPHAGVAKPEAIKHALQGYRSRCLAA
jgi:hypothetical protein